MSLLDVLRWLFSLPAVWATILIFGVLGVMGLLKKRG